MSDMNNISDLIQIGITLGLIAVGYVGGTVAEKKHYGSIKEREHSFLNLPAVTTKTLSDEENAKVKKVELVFGAAVISEDYFKSFVASLKNLFGGRLTTYESLLDRARREAILRMKEKAPKADVILNLKLESSNITKKEGSNREKTVASVSVMAYGTAVTFKK